MTGKKIHTVELTDEEVQNVHASLMIAVKSMGTDKNAMKYLLILSDKFELSKKEEVKE